MNSKLYRYTPPPDWHPYQKCTIQCIRSRK